MNLLWREYTCKRLIVLNINHWCRDHTIDAITTYDRSERLFTYYSCYLINTGNFISWRKYEKATFHCMCDIKLENIQPWDYDYGNWVQRFTPMRHAERSLTIPKLSYKLTYVQNFMVCIQILYKICHSCSFRGHGRLA